MYREEKATQMAVRLVSRAGGRLNYVKLMKLMYLCDRNMLVRHGAPITFDRWVSMKHGPVLSETYDRIKSRSRTYWKQHLNTDNYDVVLKVDPGDDALSVAEDDAIDAVYQEHGATDTWDLVQATHDLHEWQDPRGSSRPIEYREILEDEGMSADSVDAVLDDIRSRDLLDRMVQSVGR